MTKIAIAARYADDTPYGHGRLTIRLVDGGSGAALPNGLGVTPRTVNLDADGEAIVDLTPNADISDPVGTFYAVTVNDSTPTVVRYIEVPAPNGSGNSEIPYDWDDDTIQRLVPEPPSSIPAAAQGSVGQVLGIVDDGNGKEYRPVDVAPSDIGAVPTSRTVAGQALSADVSASTLAGALPVWQTIANVTLGSASGSQTFNVTGYRAVQVTFIGRSNRTSSIIDSIRLRFNSDTGSNYSVNTGAFTTTAQVFDIPSENTNTDRSSFIVIRYGYMAGAQLAGSAIGEATSSTATTAANIIYNGFIWKGAVSAAPTSLEIYAAVGQFAAGSSFLVEGRA